MASVPASSISIDRRPEYADILKDEERYGIENAEDVGSRINGWFDRLMIQSGINIAPSLMLALCAVCAIFVAAFMFVLQENLLTTALGGLLGAMLPIAWAAFARARRQKSIMEQMPGMVEELARASRTGRSLENCFLMVAEDTPHPLGHELQLCGRKLQMGLTMREALRDLPDRTGVRSLSVFTMALALHQETGGDLIHVLERLSRTVRDRMLFLGRLRAATAASRATALLMILLPVFVIGFFLFRDPNYLTNLLSSSWGSFSLILAIILQVIGSIWVIRILQSSSRV